MGVFGWRSKGRAATGGDCAATPIPPENLAPAEEREAASACQAEALSLMRRPKPAKDSHGSSLRPPRQLPQTAPAPPAIPRHAQQNGEESGPDPGVLPFQPGANRPASGEGRQGQRGRGVRAVAAPPRPRAGLGPRRALLRAQDRLGRAVGERGVGGVGAGGDAGQVQVNLQLLSLGGADARGAAPALGGHLLGEEGGLLGQHVLPLRQQVPVWG